MKFFSIVFWAMVVVLSTDGSWANVDDSAFPVKAPETANRGVVSDSAEPTVQSISNFEIPEPPAVVEKQTGKVSQPESESQSFPTSLEPAPSVNTGITEDMSPRDDRIKAALRDQKIKMALEKAQREMFYGRNIQVEHREVEEVFRSRAEAKKPPVILHGDLRTEMARRIYGGDRVSKLKNQLTLNATGKWSDDIHFRLSGRANYDGVYEFDYYNKDVVKDQKYEIELRETYVDFSRGPFDLRVGKQQIVWGESAWAFVADVVNGKDYREFILADFDRIRIPEWGTDLEFTHDDFHSELIFIPVPEMDRIPKLGAEFGGQLPLPPLTLATSHDPKDPKAGFENSKIGGRVSYLFNSLDLGAFYLHGWNGTPVLFRTINSGVYNFDPQFKRRDVIGGTFSYENGGTVYKGELAYAQKGYFSVLDPADADGVETSPYFDYALGLNRTVFEKINVDAQIIQRYIPDYKATFFPETDKRSTIAAVSMQRDFINHKLEADIRVMVGLEKFNILYRTGLRYNLTDNVQAKTGAELFAGESDTALGYYRDSSRYYCGLTWKF